MQSDACMHHKVLFAAIYMQQEAGVRALRIPHAQFFYHYSEAISILTFKLYTAMSPREIDSTVFFTQSFNFGYVPCLDLELTPKIMYSW